VQQISWSNNIIILEKCETDFQKEYLEWVQDTIKDSYIFNPLTNIIWKYL
jgi:hypothetical protein